jgi:hypothetical protein
MNQFMSTIFISALAFGAYSAFAEDKTNTKDAMDGLTQDQKPSSKMMDTNADGMVSKDEFMAHHEKMYSSMKQTNGGVSIKDMDDEMHNSISKGNKLQPSDTKKTSSVKKSS